MNWWKKFPWRRLLAAVAIAVALISISSPAEGKTMYVGVDGTNKDAVVLTTPDWLGEPAGRLKLNQEVEMLDEEKNEYVKVRATVKIRGREREVEGWVKKVILRKSVNEAELKASEAEGAEAAELASKGLNEKIEREMAEENGDMEKWLEKVNKFEATRNKLLGGDEKEPDPIEERKHYREFGEEGRLIN